jgi:hypothetical protein
MAHIDDSDIVLGSRTQDLETIQAVLDGAGYEPIESAEITDEPAEEEHPAGQPTETPGTPEQPSGETPAELPEEPEPAAAVEPPAAEPERKKKRPGKLERELHKKDTLIADLTSRLETLEKNSAGTASNSEVPAEAPAAKPEPQLDDFVTALGEDEKYELAVQRYTKALIGWQKEDDTRQTVVRAVTDQEQARKDADEADRTALADEWNAQIVQAKAAHPDWEEKISQEFDEPVTNAVMTAAVQTLEEGAELVYWLADHPEEAARIQKMTTLKPNPSATQINRAFAIAYRELGKAGLSAATEPETPTEPHAAPSPATPQGTPAARESRAVAAAQPPAPKRAQTKSDPPTPVGSRGGSPVKSRIEDYTESELRQMPNEEYRRLRGM